MVSPSHNGNNIMYYWFKLNNQIFGATESEAANLLKRKPEGLIYYGATDGSIYLKARQDNAPPKNTNPLEKDPDALAGEAKLRAALKVAEQEELARADKSVMPKDTNVIFGEGGQTRGRDYVRQILDNQ